MRKLLLLVLTLVTVAALQVSTPAASAGPAFMAAASLCTPQGCKICNVNKLRCANVGGTCVCV